MEPYDDAFYFPAYSDNKVVGIYTITNPRSNDSSIAFGVQFAPALYEAIKENGSDYFLVVNDSQTFYYGSGNAKLLYEAKPGTLPYEFVNEYTPSLESVSENSYPTTKTLEENEQRYIYTDFTEDQLVRCISNNKSSFLYNTDLMSTLLSKPTGNFVNITPATTRAVDYLMLSVGHEDQGSTAYCWAVATQLTGSYVSGINNYTYTEIGNILGIGPNDGGNNIDIIDGLDVCYGVTGTSKNGYYSYENTKWWIDRNKPIIAMCYPSSGWGHTVTVCGYYYNYNRIIFSESYGTQADSYLWIQANSNGSFDVPVNGVNFRWTYSVTV